MVALRSAKARRLASAIKCTASRRGTPATGFRAARSNEARMPMVCKVVMPPDDGGPMPQTRHAR